MTNTVQSDGGTSTLVEPRQADWVIDLFGAR